MPTIFIRIHVYGNISIHVDDRGVGKGGAGGGGGGGEDRDHEEEEEEGGPTMVVKNIKKIL